MEKTCTVCKITKDFSEFNNHGSRVDGKQSYCTACKRIIDKKHYDNSADRRQKIKERNKSAHERNRQFLVEHLNTHHCVDCGESEIIFLDFDHVNGKKSYNVSAMTVHSLETLKKEVEKCEIRCIKCHRRRTATQQGWYKLLLPSSSGKTTHS